MHAHASGTDTRILRIVYSQTNFRQWKIVVSSLIMHCITQYSYYQLILYNENTSLTSVIMVLQTNTMVFKNIVIKSPANPGGL